jgi:hypothetical protein
MSRDWHTCHINFLAASQTKEFVAKFAGKNSKNGDLADAH